MTMRERDYQPAGNHEVKAFPQLRGLRVEDIQAASADYLKSQVTGQRPYVAGAEILRTNSATIADIAAALNQARGNNPTYPGRMGQISAALTTGDLQYTLATMMSETIRDSHQFGIRNISKFCAPLEVQDFKRTNHVEAEISGVNQVFEAGEPSLATLAHSGENVQLASFQALLTITRHALLNNDIELLKRGVGKFARAAAKKERALCYLVLSSNPTLKDGNPLIGTPNTVTGSAGTTITVTDIGKAFAALARLNDEAGDDSDAIGRYILAPPELATEASSSVIEAYGSDSDIEVISAANLPDGFWYVLADPEEYPVIGRVTLEGVSLTVDPVKNDATFKSDGAAMKALLDVNYVPLSRVGIVRVDQQ